MTYDIVIAKPQVKEAQSSDIIQKYLAFCDGEMNRKTLWFLVPMMTIALIFMPIGVIVMSAFPWYIPFVGLSMILFFTNIITSIVGANTRIVITLYLVTLLIHVLIPVISLMFAAS